jgi:gluconate kinase
MAVEREVVVTISALKQEMRELIRKSKIHEND